MKDLKIDIWAFTLLLIVLFWALWLWNGFVALFICLCFAAMTLFALFLMAMAEKIEPSRVQMRRLYAFYFVATIVPLAVSALAIYVFHFPTFITLK